ncbi:MAG: nucleotide exchange factor GrpE [Kiritimatiellia bacterium]
MNTSVKPEDLQDESLQAESAPESVSPEEIPEVLHAEFDEGGGEASAEEAAAPAGDPEEESYKIQYLRLRADFDNFRKRTRREKEEWTQRCLENLCTDLLTVLDHFDLGITNSEGKEFTEDTLKGFTLVRSQLGSTLGKYGLKSIEATEGTFDPNVHEAITHIPSPEVPEDEIVAMTRKGYQLGNRLLRPAQVVVSSGSGEDVSDPEDPDTEEQA